MRVVFGEGPLAHALAHSIGVREPVVWAHAGRPEAGPFLWRHADVTTGEGVRHACEGAQRVYLVLDAPRPTDGLFVLLSRARGLRGAVVLPLGAPAPTGLASCPTLSRVHAGPAWGPDEPLVASWARTIAARQRVWLADPGPIRALSHADVVAYVAAAGERPGARWTVAGDRAVRLPELAAALADGLHLPLRAWTVPTAWAMRRAGVATRRVTAWVATPDARTVSDDWTPPRTVGAAGWLGDPRRWVPGRDDPGARGG